MTLRPKAWVNQHDEKYMVSFDVTSLFTNIPLQETIDIAVDLLLNNYNIKMSRIQMYF